MKHHILLLSVMLVSGCIITPKYKTEILYYTHGPITIFYSSEEERNRIIEYVENNISILK